MAKTKQTTRKPDQFDDDDNFKEPPTKRTC